MATNTTVNKVIYGGETLIDLTADTVSPDKVLDGITFHDKSGASGTGTCTYDSDTSDATVAVAEVLKDKTFYARGTKATGTMPNNGAVTGNITTKAQKLTIAQGYHDGSGYVQIATTEQDKIVASNIRQGITIFGVEGSMSGSEGVVAQAKTVTPTTAVQTVMPDDGYTHLSQVTVDPIPYAESDNSAGGKTVTIG